MTAAPADELIERAVATLRRGGLVAFPTETVYGLGADATNPDAVRRVFAAKGRPSDHPLIVHIGSFDLLRAVAAEISDDAAKLARSHWPGSLTLVVNRAPGSVAREVTGGRDTVAVRVPDHPVALSLLRRFGGPVAAPSANPFGRVSPTTAADVHADLDVAVDVILDGGPCAVGVESTIVDCTTARPEILRVGGVGVETLTTTLGHSIDRQARPEGVPGSLPSHYAPRARVVLCSSTGLSAVLAELAERGERGGVIASDVGSAELHGVAVLGVPASNDEYARNLYQWLRAADENELDVVVAVPPADSGLGAAVLDRLERASRGSGGD